MADINYNAANGALGRTSGQASLMDRVRGVFESLVEHRRLRLAERELSALDDRMLEDIGVPRGEIHHRVWGTGC